MRNILIFIIKLYRMIISPIFPPACRFVPSCSEYSIQAIRKHGPLWGITMSGWRILRCNPFVHGGEDPVPQSVEQWKKKWLNKNWLFHKEHFSN
ncbi:membrane protein insertion efficiency factor YidD [bacterium]|nr:MAG: membrane protein insertion efficiency factor YidD [bacterium]